MRHITRTKLASVLLAASLFALGACASVANDPPTLSEEHEVVEADPGDAEVQVSLENADITLRPNEVEAGTVVFHIWNNGDVNHDFEIRDASGKIVDEELKFTLDPDNREDFKIDLRPGSYVVLCTIGAHQDQGERATLRVR